VPVPVFVPALFAPLVPLVPLLVPLGGGVVVEDPGLFAPLVPGLVRSGLVPVFVRVRSVSLVFVRVRSVSLVFVLLGRVVGGVFVAVSLARGVALVSLPVLPVSLLSQPTNAMPPSASAAATKML